VDRHQHIGLGHIGAEAFCRITHHEKLRKIPFILETPIDKDHSDKWNLARIRELSMREAPCGSNNARWISPVNNLYARGVDNRLIRSRGELIKPELTFTSYTPKYHPAGIPMLLQIASNVESRIAFALLFFNTEMLAIVMPTSLGELGDAHFPLC